MTYIALARKWRPRTFAELVGQNPIVNALSYSLNHQRLHHAYLFTGTRGVGKTSIGRLFAKALNCVAGISAEPCLECDACVSIEQGRFIDLIEIDGASRTKVEDTRDILENVPYAPTNARFKIYLIDEVHMLSQHSFNALLKTLEEPPSHVKFLLATTDPHKLPVTILSRCLQFHLRELPDSLIVPQLKWILEKEGIRFEEDALLVLAKAAKGSLRDALSLLDQSIAICAKFEGIRSNEVKELLGYTREDYSLQLLEGLVRNDSQLLLKISKKIAQEGGYFVYVLQSLLTYLHHMAIFKALPNGDSLLPIDSLLLKKLAKEITEEDIQLYYQIGLKGLDEIGLAPSMAIGFEMTLLRMLTFKPAPLVKPPSLTCNQDLLQFRDLGSQKTLSEPDLNQELSLSTKLAVTKEDRTSSDKIIWAELISQLKLSGLTLNAAQNADFVSTIAQKFTLKVAKGHQSLFTPTIVKRLEQSLSTHYKENIRIILNVEENVYSTPAKERQVAELKQREHTEQLLNNDPFFQQLKQEFSAEVVKNSIVTVKDPL